MAAKCQPHHSQRSLEELETQFANVYGVIVGGGRLAMALGYPSLAAFRKAVERNKVPVPLMEVEGRRGKFAWANDIALWAYQGISVPLPSHEASASVSTSQTGRSPMP